MVRGSRDTASTILTVTWCSAGGSKSVMQTFMGYPDDYVCMAIPNTWFKHSLPPSSQLVRFNYFRTKLAKLEDRSR